MSPPPTRPLTDRQLALLIAAASLLLYLVTLAPGVANLADDSLEFQYLGWPGAIPHPTGYPLYALLLTATAHLLPLGELAWRANLLSAIFASGALGLTFLIGRRLGLSRLGAVAAAAFFALSATFWAQATVAEVYGLHFLLMTTLVWAVLRWADSPQDPSWLVLAAASTGLGLAHHRMIVLWLPALLLFVWLTRRERRAAPRLPWRAMLVALLLPLSFYAWLPLRAPVGSLDGSYSEVGFTCWVTACQYQSTFLWQSNSLADPVSPTFFLSLTLMEIGWLGLGLTLLGAIWLWRHPARWLLVLGGMAGNAFFAVAFVVPDREVFWLPALWCLTLLTGAGVTAVERTLVSRTNRSVAQGGLALGLVLALVVQGSDSLPDWQASIPHPFQHGERVNGIDMLGQPFPDRSVIIALQGEATYLEYLKVTQGPVSDVATRGVPTDPAELRLGAVEESLASDQAPFLTRPLAGAAERWSLSALGPLVRVQSSPRTTLPDHLSLLNSRMNDAVTLAGWRTDPVAADEGQWVTLAWQVQALPAGDWKVSLRRVSASGETIAQHDAIPVHNAYPTPAWRPGEIILDSYHLPPPPTDPGWFYQAILYEAQSGAEVGRAEWQP